jgi:hypothetical protein
MQLRWRASGKRQGAKLQELRRKYPEGIMSFSPALTDEIGLRWVVNHKLKSTLNGLNQNAATAIQPPLGLMILWNDDPG